MQVFKTYFKIVKKRLPLMLIYFGVFVGVAMIITSITGNTGAAAFVETRSKVALFDRDGSPLSKGLAEYVKANAVLVDIPDDGQSVQDALFGGNIEYALRIPEGFSRDFMSGGTPSPLQRTSGAGSTGGVYMDFVVERYLNMAQLYVKNAPNLSEEQVVADVASDLGNSAEITVKKYNGVAGTDTLAYYFNYLAYSILAVMILGVSSFMMAFNDTDLTNRTRCSPLTQAKLNMQVIAGNAVFALVVWVAMCAMVFITYGKTPILPVALLLCVNALAMTIVGLSIGFLAGKFVRNPGVQSGVVILQYLPDGHKEQAAV